MQLYKTGPGLYKLVTIGYTFEGSLKALSTYWFNSGYRMNELRMGLKELRDTKQPTAFFGVLNGGFMFCGKVLTGAKWSAGAA